MFSIVLILQYVLRYAVRVGGRVTHECREFWRAWTPRQFEGVTDAMLPQWGALVAGRPRIGICRHLGNRPPGSSWAVNRCGRALDELHDAVHGLVCAVAGQYVAGAGGYGAIDRSVIGLLPGRLGVAIVGPPHSASSK